ncbi:MAG: cupin domain-containing protein [Pseudomonadota bacterium]
MSALRVFADNDPGSPILESTLRDVITGTLADVGVRFEQWEATVELDDDATQDDVIAAYRDDIDRIMAAGGYQAVDVIRMHPDHPDRAMLRQKFLDEHTHADDEVRFFVDGRGLFSLHVGERVYEVLCERGDLISVPAGTPHWFDMGPAPRFAAIRIFINPEGWVANFTGSDIASHFDRLEA